MPRQLLKLAEKHLVKQGSFGAPCPRDGSSRALSGPKLRSDLYKARFTNFLHAR